jgi:hypothetical protein
VSTLRWERVHEPLLPRKAFMRRLAGNAAVGLIFVTASLAVGMIGFHGFEQMSWLDAFVNASMLLSGMGPLSMPQTVGGKLFAGCYALFSGLAVLLVAGLLFAPIIHRFLHHMHLRDSAGG